MSATAFQPAPDLLLKVTPPRASRQLLAREALLISGSRLRELPTLLVQAPAGFGKTSLLAQWRLDLIGHGSAVAWFGAQPQDDGARLLQGLCLAVRAGASRPGFGQALLEDLPGLAPLEGLTRWLAELAHLALDLVLIVDEADRLPPATCELLAYLLRNQPPNLRCIVAARSDCGLQVEDLIAYGQALQIGASELRFALAETLGLIRGRLGAAVDADLAARLHERCEGWPLGLQLVLSQLSNAAELRATLDALDQGEGPLRQRLLELLLSKLAAEDLRLLEDCAIVDHLHPALCQLLSGQLDAAQRLARLARDTPLLSHAEHGDWLRLHALAREQLRERVAQRPAAEQAALHGRAAAWLKQQGLLEAAGRHAWAAGDQQQALDLAERSLYEALTQHGRQSAVREWLDRLPPEALAQRPRLQLAAAWSLATGERHAEAAQLVERLLAGAGDDDAELRCECALILGSAAIFADEPDRFAALHEPWAERPPLRGPLLLAVHANRQAFHALLLGRPAAARQHLSATGGQGLRYITHWADLIQGLSYLWEGQVRPAEAQLQPSLQRAEAQLGRRSPFACMQAALLAACLWEQGRAAEASELLAHRLDVIERSGLPEAVLLAYRTLARVASASGAEHRALELLAAMDAVGQSRALPRLRLVSLAEQIRLHARRYRSETCKALLAQMDALLADPALPQGPLWRRGVDMQAALARGHAALAAREWRAALGPLEQAAQAAVGLQLGRFRIEALGLRAFAMDRCGEREARALLREVVDLAEGLGLQRVFADAHPDLGDWVAQSSGAAQAASPPAVAALAAAMPASPAAVAASSAPRTGLPTGTALTPKEREVLDLLARNLSNKEVALAMQVGEETIKWHVKNLFAKLDAGTRKQVVARARILGLLGVGE